MKAKDYHKIKMNTNWRRRYTLIITTSTVGINIYTEERMNIADHIYDTLFQTIQIPKANCFHVTPPPSRMCMEMTYIRNVCLICLGIERLSWSSDKIPLSTMIPKRRQSLCKDEIRGKMFVGGSMFHHHHHLWFQEQHHRPSPIQIPLVPPLPPHAH